MEDTKIQPSHYRGFSNGAQPVDIAERLNFNRGTALVYIARAGRKQGESVLDDLEKAQWFLEREINRIISDGKESARSVTDGAPAAESCTLKVEFVLEVVMCDLCDTYFGIPLNFDGEPFTCPLGHRNTPRVFEREADANHIPAAQVTG